MGFGHLLTSVATAFGGYDDCCCEACGGSVVRGSLVTRGDGAAFVRRVEVHFEAWP